ncbi:MAG: hypothetical protein KDB63_15590 [Nocardioidaceae bacterium]|nr:hypothetical protein [Nocardioidaceae bacterium]
MLLVALGGLFAMHGLSDHGLGGPDVSGHAHASADSPAWMHAATAMGEAASAGMTEGGVNTAATVEVPDHPAPGHHSMLVDLCLAVLAAVLIAVGTVMLARTRAAHGLLRRRHTSGSSPAQRVTTRGPAPPLLNLLCVRRC